MIRIAICDDDSTAVTRHAEIVQNTLQMQGIGFEVETYTDSDNLLYDISDDNFFYDLLLLDIEMPGISGMDLCSRIKSHLPNVKVIFITSHIEYAIDAFELCIFRYVPKSELEKRLAIAIADAAKLIEIEGEREYVIKKSTHMEKIPYRDILYIQRDGKNVSIKCNTGISKVRKSLQQVYNELSAQEFIYIDRSYIVNIIQIMKICNSNAVLRNGESLPISRSHLQDVKQIINKFWGAHI